MLKCGVNDINIFVILLFIYYFSKLRIEMILCGNCFLCE